MRTSLKILGCLVMCCGAASCSRSNDVGSKYAKTQNIQALTGGTMNVTASDDPNLAGAVLQVPPKSLAADTTITVAVESDGTVKIVNTPDLTIDTSASTVAFTAVGFTRFAPRIPGPNACPPNS